VGCLHRHVVTVERTLLGDLRVTGTTEENGTVVRVTVNGKPAKSIDPNFATWEKSICTVLMPRWNS
jgi:hypothetical protein